MDTVDESIKKTKDSFEKRFTERKFYDKQTHDDKHLNMMIKKLNITSGMKILDLGTGNGYVAFAIARNNKQCHIVGLDIVIDALKRNRLKARQQGLYNLEFISYDGKNFPFQNGEFDIIVSRYVLHHFPIIENCFAEISRVLKPSGKLLISDPSPTKEDGSGFIDDYMKLFDDGHIKYYTKEEFVNLAEKFELGFIDNIETVLNFPKERDKAIGFKELLNNYDQKVKNSYKVNVFENEIYMSQPVNNLLFEKAKPKTNF
ncbi:MAG: methyltransferase domain-containing protein [Clostridia bacterium]|nr:methyltransferase domain-containing protein [Clostridia bacterium]